MESLDICGAKTDRKQEERKIGTTGFFFADIAIFSYTEALNK
jgi:hypothetical protein